MSTVVPILTRSVESDIVSAWKELPLHPDLFAVELLKRRPDIQVTKGQIIHVLERYKKHAQFKESRRARPGPERSGSINII